MDSTSRLIAARPLVPSTPAQELFAAACEGAAAHDKASFAALLGVDPGNIYNYLTDAGKPNWIPAKTETLRRWGRTISQSTGGRLAIRVTEDADGVVEVAVVGTGSAGPVDRTVRRSPEELSAHVLGNEAGRGCCDGVLAALAAHTDGSERRIREKQCELIVGKCVLTVEHGPENHVRVYPVHGRAEPGALIGALDREALPWELHDGKGGVARAATRQVVVRVGDDDVFPEQLARALAMLHGWEANVGQGTAPEHEDAASFTEGGLINVQLTRFERDPKARAACLAHHGLRCAVCDLSFRERYGSLGEGFIHVHHVTPLSARREEHHVDPVRDLVPVCPNCHAMIHRGRGPARSIRELRAIRARAARPATSADGELAGDP